MTQKEFFKRLLTPFWLRPESALWYAHEAFLVQEYVGTKLKSPSLELGCMDGTSSFVMLGGEFGTTFDVYKEVSWSRDSVRWKSYEQDYYNTVATSKVDHIDIKTKPTAKFDVGISGKKAHLIKPGRLGIYDELVEHDLNKPLTMLKNEQFATVWAPNFYWIDQLDTLLREVHRILRPDGRLVAVVPDSSALKHMIYQFKDRTDPEWIQDLDRGRYGNIARQARTFDQWSHFFEIGRAHV